MTDISHQTLQAAPADYRLMISVTIEADYRSRGVFPGLRLDKAETRMGTSLFFTVPLAFAYTVQKDAQARREDGIGFPRGLLAAYTALLRNLRAGLDRAEGVTDDPGLEKWLDDVRAASGLHKVGEVCLSDRGEEVTITHAFGDLACYVDDGQLRDRNGKRFDYRPGYFGTSVCNGTTKSYHWSPHQLLSRDGEVTHLRLVRVNGGAV